MLPACYSLTHVRYKFPACSDLVFRTDLVSSELTLVLYHHSIGRIEFTKTTDAQGRFTLLLSDLPKPYLLNPWIGFFNLSFIHESSEYDIFLSESAEYVHIELQAELRLAPPVNYTFMQFTLQLAEEEPPPPDEEESTYFADSYVDNPTNYVLNL